MTVGFISGVVGELFARSFVFDYFSETEEIVQLNNIFYELLSKYNFLTKTEEDGPLELIIRRPQVEGNLSSVDQIEVGNILENLKHGTITFYQHQKPTSQDLLLSSYQKTDALGRGFVLTNGGWIITNNNVLFGKQNRYVAITNDGRVYEVKELIQDTLTPVVFAKIETSNAPVLGLAKKEKISSGQAIVTLDDRGGVKISRVENSYYRRIAGNRDLVISSDELDNYYLPSDSFENVFSGEVVIDKGGKVIGSIVEENGQKLILPLINFENRIDEVLRDKDFFRVGLGVNYLNLSQLTINPEVSQEYQSLNRGALIYESKSLGVDGIQKGSPAEKAGLKSGQVILKVEGEEINNNTSLSQLIQEYKAGDEVELRVWQNGEEKSIMAVLESLE